MADEEKKVKEKKQEQLPRIWVTSNLKKSSDGLGSPTALFEIDANHPGGQAFVHGRHAVEVATTAGVVASIRAGNLREVDEREAKRLNDEHARSAEERRQQARAAELAQSGAVAPVAVAELQSSDFAQSRFRYEDLNRSALERIAKEHSVKFNDKTSDADLIAQIRAARS